MFASFWKAAKLFHHTDSNRIKQNNAHDLAKMHCSPSTETIVRATLLLVLHFFFLVSLLSVAHCCSLAVYTLEKSLTKNKQINKMEHEFYNINECFNAFARVMCICIELCTMQRAVSFIFMWYIFDVFFIYFSFGLFFFFVFLSVHSACVFIQRCCIQRLAVWPSMSITFEQQKNQPFSMSR